MAEKQKRCTFKVNDEECGIVFPTAYQMQRHKKDMGHKIINRGRKSGKHRG